MQIHVGESKVFTGIKNITSASSSNPSVLTISFSVNVLTLTGVAVGSATVTVYFEGESNPHSTLFTVVA